MLLNNQTLIFFPDLQSHKTSSQILLPCYALLVGTTHASIHTCQSCVLLRTGKTLRNFLSNRIISKKFCLRFEISYMSEQTSPANEKAPMSSLLRKSVEASARPVK